MPRGYLKHQSRNFGRKKARGGSSKDFGRKKSKCGSNRTDQEENCSVGRDKTRKASPAKPRRFDTPTDDFFLSSKKEKPKQAKNDKMDCRLGYPVSECLICFESKPVVQMSKACHWHGGSCQTCLRRIYVTDPPKNSNHYPLRCFHPFCQENIHPCTMKHHKLLQSESELEGHYERNARAKRENKNRMYGHIEEKHRQLMLENQERRITNAVECNKRKGMRTMICPSCRFPKRVGKLQQDVARNCPRCKIEYLISPNYATLRALERIQSDNFGDNNGIGRCPRCKIYISKGYGCASMSCGYCHNRFSWDDAVCPPLARPHDSETICGSLQICSIVIR